jgi:hypothetical protein
MAIVSGSIRQGENPDNSHRIRRNALRRVRYKKNPAPFLLATKEWAANNRERRRAYQQAWYQQKRERIRIERQRDYKAHRERECAKSKEYYQTHRQAVRERQRRYYVRKQAEKAREGLRKSAGALKGVDHEAVQKDEVDPISWTGGRLN